MTSTRTQVEGVTKGYGGRQGLRGLSLSVASGEILGTLGASGAGKTTAVKSVEALRPRDGGRTRVLGFEPAEQRGRMRHLVIFPAPVL
jgi:ABC-type multidrug transport system ATPase subunit